MHIVGSFPYRTPPVLYCGINFCAAISSMPQEHIHTSASKNNSVLEMYAEDGSEIELFEDRNKLFLVAVLNAQYELAGI